MQPFVIDQLATPSSIFHPLSCILYPPSSILILAEGERFELSRAEARQFSGLLQYRYANPPNFGRSARIRTETSDFGDRDAASYTTLLQNAEERNRTSAGHSTSGFTDHRLPTRPPQRSANTTYQVFKQQRAKLAPNLNTVSESGSAPKSLYGMFSRFGSGRTAPAESRHSLAIIGEPLFSRFGTT